MFFRNARELSELQPWEGLGRIAKVHRDTKVDDAHQLQRDLEPLLGWSVSRSLSDNLARAIGGLVIYLEETDFSSAMMDGYCNWLKGQGKTVKRLWAIGLNLSKFQMVVRQRCQFLFPDGDPSRLIEVRRQ